MKICMPVEKANGMNSMLHMHFGSAPCFIIYDTSTKQFTSMDNGDHAHMEGHCNPVQQFQANPIDVLITSNMGGRALSIFNESRVKVYSSATETTVAQVVAAFENGKLVEISSNSVCDCHHNCDH